MTRTNRVFHGIYRTIDGRFEIRRSESGGWDLFEITEMRDDYWNSFSTKADALAAAYDEEWA